MHFNRLLKRCDRRQSRALGLISGLILLISLSGICQAQVTIGPQGLPLPEQPSPPVIVREFSLAPAAAHSPLLKYVLYPRLSELKPGNAATQWSNSLTKQKIPLSPLSISNVEIHEVPIDEVEEYLAPLEQIFSLAEEAAFMEDLDWDEQYLSMRGTEAFFMLDPHKQEARNLASALTARARLDIIDGDYESAIKNITVLMRLCRDAAQSTSEFNVLMGTAMQASTMIDTVRPFINQPDSPNLYWALMQLPTPFFDLQTSIEAQIKLPERVYEIFESPETSDRSQEEWNRLLLQAYRDSLVMKFFDELLITDSQADKDSMTISFTGFLMEDLNMFNVGNTPEQLVLLSLVERCLQNYPLACKALVDAGWDSEKVEAMPVAQVIAIHEKLLYDQYSHLKHALSLLPVSESMERHRSQQTQTAVAFNDYTVTPVLWHGTSYANIKKIQDVLKRQEQTIAAFIVVEAIRMHLAENDDQLPKSLSEITVVPIPNDPWTGQPFHYELLEDKAVINIPFPNRNQKFEIRLHSTHSQNAE